jgi:hypothetical protein
MAYVDFVAPKHRVTIEQTAVLLGLNTKPAGSQHRAACTSCKEGGDQAIVITPEKGLFHCFPGKGVSQKDAAFLMSGEKSQGVPKAWRFERDRPRLWFGFLPKGIMRGRFAVPVHDRSGTLLAYCGRTVKDESPQLLFPNGFNPASAIFNAPDYERRAVPGARSAPSSSGVWVWN